MRIPRLPKSVRFRTAAGGVLILALTLLVCPTDARATTAAGTLIDSIATADYLDDQGRPFARDVNAPTRVNLVVCAPGIDAPPDQTSPYIDASSSHVYGYNLTACANGVTTYDVDAFPLGQANNDGLSLVFTSVDDVRLGATSVMAR